MMNINFDNSSIYSPAHRQCPLCSGSDIAPLDIIDRYDPPFSVSQCAQCGFIFMNPPFKNDIINNLYRQDYYNGTAEYSYQDERKTERYARHVWDRRIKFIAARTGHGNFLDIGAAFGGFMKSAAAYFTPYGIELSPYSGGHARSIFGDRLHIGSLDDHPFSHGSFSVITMIEVIEHIKDPSSAVKECYDLLERGGVLVIQTANMQARQARVLKDRYAYFLPGHLSYFSMKNLTGLLRKHGFTTIKVYCPVEFGLLPKLLKSRHSFRKLSDYRAWIPIIWYHVKSKIHWKDFAMTSSMVVYAYK